MSSNYTFSEAFKTMHRERDEAKAEARELRSCIGQLHVLFVYLADLTRPDQETSERERTAL